MKGSSLFNVAILYPLSVPALLWDAFCQTTSRERESQIGRYCPWGRNHAEAAGSSIGLLTRRVDDLAVETPIAVCRRRRKNLKELRALIASSEPRVSLEVLLSPHTYRLLEANAAAWGCTEEQFVLGCLMYHSQLEEMDRKRKARAAKCQATLAAKKAASIKAPPAFAAFERMLKTEGSGDIDPEIEGRPVKRKTSKRLAEIL